MHGDDEERTGELPPVPRSGPAWTFDQPPAAPHLYGGQPPHPVPSTAAVPTYEGRSVPEYETYQVPTEPSWWRRNLVAVVGAFVSVVVLATVGWIVLKPDESQVPVSAAGPSAHASRTTTTVPTSDASSPTPSPTPSSAPPSRAPTVVEVPTEKPSLDELPPPPPPPVQDTPDCIQHPGPDAPPAEVSAALVAAGNKQYWKGVQRPKGLTGPVPAITTPASLMKAVAWAESNWQSTVIACDYGIGLMQVMPDTAVWMNGRFGSNFDVNTVTGNAGLGAEYLQWLTMYFGLYYFGTFDLDASQPVGDNQAMLRLRDVVIAAYNVGYREVENLNDPDNHNDDTISIPNQWYVDRVNGYIATCPCASL